MISISSPSVLSSQSWCQSSWFHLFLFFFFIVFFSTTPASSSTAPTISYSDHCASIVPQSSPTVLDRTTFLELANTHYSGGDRILGKKSSDFDFDSEKSLSFRTTPKVYKTITSGVYKIEAYLKFRSLNDYYGTSYYSRTRSRRNSIRFLLNGFWSESSGKLCMVGSASWYSTGDILKLDSVLNLNYAENSNISTSLVNGTLVSLSSPKDPSYFEPISILAFPKMINYNYSLVSKEFDEGCSGGTDVPPDSSLSPRPSDLCRMLWRRYGTFELEYASKCNSAKNCTPSGGGIGYFPHFMSLHAIQCSEVEQRQRFLVEFPNSSYGGYYQSFDPSTTLVGEGFWDAKKKRLCIAACRILKQTHSLGNAHVEDCSIRLSLRFPAVWSLRNTSVIVGEIWTDKTVKDSGYFNRINFESIDNGIMRVHGLRYEHTQIDKVRKSCPAEKHAQKKGESYPNGRSYDMNFDMSVKDSKGNYAWGYAYPIFVGDEFSEQYISSGQDYEVEAEPDVVGPLNITYKITLTLRSGVELRGGNSSLIFSSTPEGQVNIFAEGSYDAATGQLCMIGCRKLASYTHQKSTADSVDCEILVNFQYPPVNGKNGRVITGSIQSKRKNTDPLFFDHVNVSSNAFYGTEARRSIWRMDLEIIMVLVSNTLACLFVVLQLFYVKKHPDVLPFISLVMLVILTMGHMIPLVLNIEALLENRNRQNILSGSGGWLEVNEVIVRVATMIAFLLQVRLLQLAWMARWTNGSEKGLWAAEKKALFVSLPLYILGGLIALLVNWNKNNKHGSVSVIPDQEVYQQHSLLGDLRSYAGLVLDGFLFPQFLLNIFQRSIENALSPSFYVGITSVRLLPHAYDLYRTHNYVPTNFNGSYIYANPGADFYSTAWDVIIPCVGMLFTAIIYLQQRFGGRCILPRRFKELELYEKVPEISSE